MRLAANADRAPEVVRVKRVDRLENQLPILFPRAEHFLALGVVVHDKFPVAIAVGLLAVAGQEIGEARAHVARQVLHDDCDTVGFRIGRRKELFIAELRDGAVCKALVTTQAAEDFVNIEGVKIAHWLIVPWALFQGLRRNNNSTTAMRWEVGGGLPG